MQASTKKRRKKNLQMDEEKLCSLSNHSVIGSFDRSLLASLLIGVKETKLFQEAERACSIENASLQVHID